MKKRDINFLNNNPIEKILRFSYLLFFLLILMIYFQIKSLVCIKIIGVGVLLLIVYSLYAKIYLDLKMYDKFKKYYFGNINVTNGYLIKNVLYYFACSVLLILMNSKFCQINNFDIVSICYIVLISICLLIFVKIKRNIPR